ncbi:MAG: NBR1-Ig-like domain-containing protein [Anaerolineaceae bacterium]
MRTKKPFFGLFLLLMIAAILTGCSFGAAKPSEDPMLIYTQAQQTVAAQLTGTAAMMPAATETPLPTNTVEPTATATTVPPSPTLPVLSTTSTTGSPVVAATATTGSSIPTSTSISQKTGDSAAYGTQSPADNSTFGRDEEFTLIINLINNGTTTWTADYKLVFQSGTPLSAISQIPCSRDTTKPMETCDFYIAAKTPLDPGKYISRYWLYNSQGVKIPGGEVYFSFVVQ